MRDHIQIFSFSCTVMSPVLGLTYTSALSQPIDTSRFWLITSINSLSSTVRHTLVKPTNRTTVREATQSHRNKATTPLFTSPTDYSKERSLTDFFSASAASNTALHARTPNKQLNGFLLCVRCTKHSSARKNTDQHT